MAYEVASGIPWDSTGLPLELARYVEYQSRQQPGWAKFFSENVGSFMGEEVPPVMDAANPTVPVGVVQAIEQLENGGVEFAIPVETRLVKPGSVGDAPLQGTGESIGWYYRHIFVNAHQKAVRVPTGVEAQKLRDPMLNSAKRGGQKLKAWWGEMQDGNINQTWLYGIDSNLSTLWKEYLGSGVRAFSTPFSPGNFYVAGHGKVSYDMGYPKSPGYEGELKGKLNVMLNKAAASVTLTAARLRAFLAATQMDNIRKVKTPMGLKRCVVMNNATWIQLKNDPEFMDFHKFTLPSEYSKNPYFEDVAVVWENALIYVFNGLWGVRTENNQVITHTAAGNTLGCPHYGPDGFWISESGDGHGLDTNELALVYTFGPGAMYKAFGRNRFEIDMDDSDFKKLVEYGLFAYVSFVRSDNFDDDGNRSDPGTWKYNDSFAVMAVRSPQNYGF